MAACRAIFDDTGRYCAGSGASQQCRHNSGHRRLRTAGPHGGATCLLRRLLPTTSASSPTPIPRLPIRPARTRSSAGRVPLGIGRPTGIDLRRSGDRDAARCRLARPGATGWRPSATRARARSTAGLATVPGGCGIADGTNRPWSVGDNESLAPRSGRRADFTAATRRRVPAALANGGTIPAPAPRLPSIRAPDGTVLQRVDPPPVASHRPSTRPALAGDPDRVCAAPPPQPGGTSADVFAGFGASPPHGKTGTAQYVDRAGVKTDDGWYACLAPRLGHRPADRRGRVGCRRAASGTSAAAPVARQILSQWFEGRPGPYVSGRSTSL